MGKKFLHILLLVIVIISIFLFTCPFTYAVDSDLIFTSPMAEPTTSDYCGYVNILLRHKTEGYYRVRTIFWTSGYIVDNYTDLEGEYKVTPVVCDVYCDSDELKLDFHFDGSGGFYSVGYVWAEPVQQYGAADVNYVDGFVDTWRYTNSSFDFVGIQSYGNCNPLYNLPNSMPQFSVLFNDDALQFEQLNSIITLLDIINTNYQHIEGIKLQQILYSFEDVCSLLSSMLDVLNNIDSGIWQLEYYIETDLTILLYEIQNAVYGVQDKLQVLIDLFTSTGNSTFEELPTDSVNDYKDKEDALLDVDTSDAEESLDVVVDSSASGAIWHIIEKLLAINPLVFGLYITMLSLGVVALILNR